ncbi:MAG TPA: helix-turn-helix domain-containing protein [Patescibacteria group bacterium]|nr:helix-turn-helix domain-containing protein [Patescibacteria group bacterium]
MTPIADAGRRYRSELREQQSVATRERILDATTRVLAKGLAEVTVPAVAREAGVSVPTVYRHFGTKRDLLAALQPHLQRRAGIDRIAPPDSIDGLRGTLVSLIGGMDGLDDVARAALASPAGEEVRRIHAPNRFRLGRTIVDGVAPELPEADRDRVARLLLVMTSSSALRMWREQLGRSVEEIADEIDRAVRAVIASARGEAS